MARIGIFDSGRGGLSVLQEFLRQLPSHEYFYLADTAGFPYSNRPAEYIQQRVLQGVEFLQKEGCEVIVLACNTASLVAIEAARKEFPTLPLVGTVPALKPALEENPGQSVFVFATERSVNSPQWQEFLRYFPDSQRVISVGSTALVAAIEQEDFVRCERLLQQFSTQYSFAKSAVVLGCTHFPLILTLFQKIFPTSVRWYSPEQGVRKQLQRILPKEIMTTTDPSQVTFISSLPGAEQLLLLAAQELAGNFEVYLRTKTIPKGVLRPGPAT